MKNKNLVQFSTDIRKGLFVSIPYNTIVDKCCMNKETLIVNETIKIKLPIGNYKIIGLSHKIDEITIFKELGITHKEYIKILNKKDITVNYSDYSNFWLMVVLENKNIK